MCSTFQISWIGLLTLIMFSARRFQMETECDSKGKLHRYGTIQRNEDILLHRKCRLNGVSPWFWFKFRVYHGTSWDPLGFLCEGSNCDADLVALRSRSWAWVFVLSCNAEVIAPPKLN